MGRLVIDLHRRIELHQPALVKNGQTLADAQGFALVVGHVDQGRAEPAMQREQLTAKRGAEGVIQVRERLIQEQDTGFPRHGPAQRDPLALATGKFLWPPVQEPPQTEHFGDFTSAAAALGRDPSPWP